MVLILSILLIVSFAVIASLASCLGFITTLSVIISAVLIVTSVTIVTLIASLAVASVFCFVSMVCAVCFVLFIPATLFLFYHFLLKKYLSGGICTSTRRLDDKIVLITGATAGLGKATALELARRGAKLILGVRDVEKCENVVRKIKASTGNKNVEVLQLDLASFESVVRFADEVKKKYDKLDILVNNAGILHSTFATTDDGNELVFQTNYLGHFLLTMLLLDRLKASKSSRIVNVSSRAYELVKKPRFRITDPEQYKSMRAYSQSKFSQVVFARKLAKKLDGILVFSLHPGAINTNIFDEMIANRDTLLWSLFYRTGIFLMGKTIQGGIQTIVYCAVEDGEEMAKYNGGYFADCRNEKLRPIARDDAVAEQLWKLSLELVKKYYVEK